MQLRTFLAKDMKEALSAMRSEMGEEAIIVASEKLKDGTVLLRAGIEEAQALAHAAEQALSRDSSLEAPGVVSRFAAFEARYRENLLARLRGSRPQATQRAAAFEPAMLMEILRTHRTPEALAEKLVDAAGRSGLGDMTLALAAALDQSMRIDPIDVGQQGAILLVGPPGAGKTAVAARLAAQNCLAGCPVLLAATDLETAGQVARLENFAACLNLQVIHASSPGKLAEAVQQARTSNVLLIADSSGCDPREKLPRELVGFLSAGQMDVVGVISAASDAEEAGEIAAALARIGTNRVIVTGLDLSRRKGSVIAIAMSGATIAQVTSSPYLADGLEMLTPMALSRLLTGRAPPETEDQDRGGVPD